MLQSLEAIYNRRAMKFTPLSPAQQVAERVTVPALVAGLRNLETLGFTVNMEALSNLSQARQDDAIEVLDRLITTMREKVGADVKYEPMYPNFPQQVADASYAELYFNAMLHYFGALVGQRIMPVYETKLREAFTPEATKLIKLGSVEDRVKLFADLMSTGQPFQDRDKEELKVVFAEDPRFITSALPDSVTVKENLAFLTLLVEPELKNNPDLMSKLSRSYRTATDVLRLAVAMSDGDISLAGKSMFGKFTRPRRRHLMDLFESAASTSNIIEDMLRRPDVFKRLGERIHPGEFASKAPKALEAFNVIRNKQKVETYNSAVESMLRNAQQNHVLSPEFLKLLKSRPGDFARRLDSVVRSLDAGHNAASDRSVTQVIEAFAEIANKVSTKVLIQLANHYLNRDSGNQRITIPTGGSFITLTDPLVPFGNPDVSGEILRAIGLGMRTKFSAQESLGKVYVSEDLTGYAIPVSVQNASAASSTLGRFTRTPIDGGNTLRFFIHWKDAPGEWTDLDLSGLFLTEDFQKKSEVTYYSLRAGASQMGIHSGDITSAPNGASEFIDVDIKKCLAKGARYVVMDVRSYSMQNFSTVPECYAGYMIVDNAQAGEIFEPSLVQHKATLASESKSSFVYLFDLHKREAIWVDVSTKINDNRVNNLGANFSAVSSLSKVAAENSYLSLSELFLMHASARGELVIDRDEADIVFAQDGDVTPQDVERIMSEFMT